ncbi:uncharacterized protein LOC126578388 [Anopheles aquasalis]|uniref:uncharacterized protein LOC126578388 n=1 Tax=Anopheles aquasalis TaxID=42839 RepID=UPI00215A9D5F|nr:uncharacterized protein LOC126578388 [Anopheles aquasalis]
MYRFSLYRLVVVLCVITIGYTTVRWWQLMFGHDSGSSGPPFQHTCNMTEPYRQELERLFERVHRLLGQHGLTHFLCYGTLWGQIRMARMLPWREKAEFCVLNDELMRHEEARFIRSFLAHQLQIRYLHSEGIYRIFANEPASVTVPPYVELIVFQLDETQGMYKRVGWKRRLLPPHCDWTPSLDCFPMVLLQGSLSTRPLGPSIYTVPMGGIEIQKYHYPDNWWKDVKERNCNLN